MESLKITFIKSNLIFFFYTFLLGRTGMIYLGFIFLNILRPLDNFYWFLTAFTLFIFFNRIFFFYRVVSSLEFKDQGIKINYLINGGFLKTRFVTYDCMKVFNPGYSSINYGFWNSPIIIECLIKDKIIDFHIPPKFGLGISWEVKNEINRFIEKIKERDVLVISV